MYISRMRVRHFRSLDDLKIEMEKLVILCGPNSAGKSNVLRAIEFAWLHDSEITPNVVYENLDYHKRDGGGALSIRVDIEFADCPPKVCAKFNGGGKSLKYEFSCTRKTAKVNRKLNGVSVNEEEFEFLRGYFDVVYVPPIRDISSDGLMPFRSLLARALARGRGEKSLKSIADEARRVIRDQAELLLKENRMPGARRAAVGRLSADVEAIPFETLYEDLSLLVSFDEASVPLEAMGTGHQSEIVLNLYRQFGCATPGDTVFLFEEPDNHLHPTMIRAVADDLESLTSLGQVVATTHSPILLNRIGYGPINALSCDDNRYTVIRSVSPNLPEAQLRALVASIGIRATEPLLARRVIVVEGPSDAVVLSELHRLRKGRTPDQSDVMIIPSGGKDRLVRVCELMHSMEVDWRAVVDFDACEGGRHAILDKAAGSSMPPEVVDSLQKLKGAVDCANKTGKNAVKTIDWVLDELGGSRPSVTIFDGSHLERLSRVNGVLNATERNQLSARLRRGEIKLPRRLLQKANVFFPSSDLETALLKNAGSLDVTEKVLVDLGQQQVSARDEMERRTILISRLHNLASDSAAICLVVGALESAGLLARTDVNACYKYLFDE